MIFGLSLKNIPHVFLASLKGSKEILNEVSVVYTRIQSLILIFSGKIKSVIYGIYRSHRKSVKLEALKLLILALRPI